MNNNPKHPTHNPRAKQPRIALIVGGIAAGKSTLALKLQREQFAGSILIDVDQFVLTMPEYWKLRAVDPAGAYRRVYGEARKLAYKALAEALVRRLDLIWEIGRVGKAYGDMLDWWKQLGYRITLCGIDCPEEEALKRHERRLRDPADLLQFGRDPAWYPPPQPDANDLEEIKHLYYTALNSSMKGTPKPEPIKKVTLKPGEWLDTLDPVTFSPEEMHEAYEANQRMHEQLAQRAKPKNPPRGSASAKHYGHPEHPEGLEPEAEHVGSIYWIPCKGDMVTSWNPRFLRDMREQGFTKVLVEWANGLAKMIAAEFRSKQQ